MYISSNVHRIHVHVLDEIYELIGGISSSEDESQTDRQLENYLINDSITTLDPQGMARTKQTVRKQTSSSLPSATKEPSNELESDSSLERAFAELDADIDADNRNTGMATRSSPRTGKGSSGGGTSEPTGRGRRPKRPLEAEEKDKDMSSEESSEEEQEQPPSRHLKRSDKDAEERPKKSDKDPEESPKETRKREEDMTAKELVAHWNRTARVKKPTVTVQGWLKKTERQRDRRNRLLRRAKPGTRSLREIRFYQKCQTFLVAVRPFHHLVREICMNLDGGGNLRWQSTALFTLQCSTEAYMAGFWHDANLCAIHRKVITVNRKDVWLATEIRGWEHVGGHPQMADVGSVNTTFKGIRLADPSEKKGVRWGMILNDFASEEDWCAKFWEKAAVNTSGVRTAKGKGKGKEDVKMKRRQTVLKDALHDISRPAICRLARQGGVKRISANIYEEVREN